MADVMVAGGSDSLGSYRARLMEVAYRMLGSVSDAEDIVQDAFVRWMKADRSEVLAPEGFLCRIVTRLCLDRLKSSRHQRETYVGPWLPDPLVHDEQTDDIALPLMLVLERLSPLERAAFLLHDVFAVGFDEIALTIERDVAACRQLAARARIHLREARSRFPVDKARGRDLAQAFFEASRSGDAKGLGALLAEDVILHADSGGKRPSVTVPVIGRDGVSEAYGRIAVWLRNNPSTLVRHAYVNGLPGLVTLEADGELQTTALVIEGGLITTIYVTRNPDKLKHLH